MSRVGNSPQDDDRVLLCGPLAARLLSELAQSSQDDQAPQSAASPEVEMSSQVSTKSIYEAMAREIEMEGEVQEGKVEEASHSLSRFCSILWDWGCPSEMAKAIDRIASSISKAASLLSSLPRIAALDTIPLSSSPPAPQDPPTSYFRPLSPSPLWLGFSFLSLSHSLSPSRCDGAAAITRNACLLTASAEIIAVACAYAQALSLKRSIKAVRLATSILRRSAASAVVSRCVGGEADPIQGAVAVMREALLREIGGMVESLGGRWALGGDRCGQGSAQLSVVLYQGSRFIAESPRLLRSLHIPPFPPLAPLLSPAHSSLSLSSLTSAIRIWKSGSRILSLCPPSLPSPPSPPSDIVVGSNRNAADWPAMCLEDAMRRTTEAAGTLEVCRELKGDALKGQIREVMMNLTAALDATEAALSAVSPARPACPSLFPSSPARHSRPPPSLLRPPAAALGEAGIKAGAEREEEGAVYVCYGDGDGDDDDDDDHGTDNVEDEDDEDDEDGGGGGHLGHGGGVICSDLFGELSIAVSGKRMAAPNEVIEDVKQEVPWGNEGAHRGRMVEQGDVLEDKGAHRGMDGQEVHQADGGAIDLLKRPRPPRKGRKVQRGGASEEVQGGSGLVVAGGGGRGDAGYMGELSEVLRGRAPVAMKLLVRAVAKEEGS